MLALVPRTRTLLTTRRRWRNRVSVRRRASGRAHYNYFRDYDPAVGRYVESDPLGLAAGSGTYTYADASPAGHFDSFGLMTDDDCCSRSQQLKQNHNPSASGWPICCEGRKVACTTAGNTTTKAGRTIRKCALVHERTHFPEIPCDSCTREPTRPDRSGPGALDYNQSECRGGEAEVRCLERSKKECGTDVDCQNEVQREIARWRRYYRGCNWMRQ